MDLKHIGKKIVAAVAQRPFTTGVGYSQNVFCKLIPVFNHLDEFDKTLSPSDFYNDQEIWGMITGSSICSSQDISGMTTGSSMHIIPGMLVEVVLEEALGADETNPDKSLYQARVTWGADILGYKCGAELFQLDEESERTLSRFSGEGARIWLPHVPSRLVFFRMAGFTYGPFATILRETMPESTKAEVTIKPFLRTKKIYKIANAAFRERYELLAKTDIVSLDRFPRKTSSRLSPVDWSYLPPDEYEKVAGDFGSSWDEIDLEPIADKIARAIRSLGIFTTNERNQIKQLIDKLETVVASVDDPHVFRRAIDNVGQLTETLDKNICEFAKALMENGLLNEERLKAAEKEYLEEWINTQTEQINRGIEKKQRELDELTQLISDESEKFEFDKQHKEKDLQNRINKDLADLDAMKETVYAEIKAERDGWENEKASLMVEFEEKEHAIAAMLRQIQDTSTEQAAESIRLYPFLKDIVKESKSQSGDSASVAPRSAGSEKFAIPMILNGACRAATLAIDQHMFLSNFAARVKSLGFSFDLNDLRRFHTSVLCEGITVLAGPSGVGKSSLARIYGDVLSGGEAAPRDGTHVVHVSPTWIERSDLLGYVNTVSGEFTPSETGLYQRLIYAQEDYKMNGGDSAIYPICFDEMNLAQIEHYFNDFMQLLEQPQPIRILSCFSPEAVSSSAIFRKYASIPLAPSLRFIGTVNFDETTRRMSMRFLDRVNLITLSDAPLTGLTSTKGGEPYAGRGVCYQKYSEWIKNSNKLTPAAEKCLSELDTPLRWLGTAISPRVKVAMKKYIATSIPVIDTGDAEKIAFDEQIAQRVLSKVRSLTSSRQEKALNSVESILSDYCGTAMSQSSRLISAIREQERSFDYEEDERN